MDNAAQAQPASRSGSDAGEPKILQLGGLAGPGAAAGGVWAVASTQSAALRRAGAQVELVGGWLGKVPAASAPGTTAARLFRVRRPLPGARLRGLLSLQLPRYVASRGAVADVVHVHLCRDFLTTFTTALLGRGNTPVIAQSHGMLTPSSALPVRLFDFAITRWLVRIPRLWLTLTEEEESGLQRLGVPRTRMRRVANAAAGSVHCWTDPAEHVFLFAARLAARKQPAVFVQAAVAALDAGLEARFILAGPDQGEAAGVQALIAASGHADRFELPGELSPAQLQQAMATSTAYVLPALNEPYPMSVIEAAAAGTPLIVTAQCGLADHLRSADAALLPEPTAEAFCAAMLALAGDPQRRKELGVNARLLHGRLWSADLLAEDLHRHYAEVIGAAGGGNAAGKESEAGPGPVRLRGGTP